MPPARRDQAWRSKWKNKAPRAEFSLPTDATFAEAEEAMLDPDRDAQDKKFAALRGVPQPVSNDLCFPMWIPARELTSTFSDTEIMTSLGSGSQPAIWSANIHHLREFKTIRNAGISFVCTDRDVCSKLGGETVSICDKKFKIQPYSKYSHWYFVDLQRLPDDVTDSVIYDWFADHDTPPVYISPAHMVQGLRSRSRRVYFNHKTPPASLMIDATTPLRQINFEEHGYAVVNHRNRAFNRGVPPFIQAMRAERKAHPSTPSATRKPAHSPEKTDTRGTSQQMSDVESASFEPPDSDASDASESDDTSVSTMDGIDGEIYVKPSSVWLEEGSPKFPTGSTSDSDLEPARVKRAKQLVFGHVSTPATDFQELPTSQTHYPAFASANPYEWLSEGDGGSVPADQDLVLWDSASTPPRSVGSYVKHSQVAESILNASTIKSKVEEVSLKELCSTIKAYLKDFSKTEDVDECLADIQSQPSVHRFLLDTSVPGNYQHLRAKAFGHAVLRMVSKQGFPEGEDYSLRTRLAQLYPDAPNMDAQAILQNLCSSETDFWLQVRLAEFDLALQIIAPSIYSDPLKISALIQGEASALPHPMWHLWDDRTMGLLVTSPLAARIVAAPMPSDLRETIKQLQQAVAAATTPIRPSL